MLIMGNFLQVHVKIPSAKYFGKGEGNEMKPTI